MLLRTLRLWVRQFGELLKLVPFPKAFYVQNTKRFVPTGAPEESLQEAIQNHIPAVLETAFHVGC